MDLLQDGELVLVGLDASNEVQRGIATVDDLLTVLLNHVAHLGGSAEDVVLDEAGDTILV